MSGRVTLLAALVCAAACGESPTPGYILYRPEVVGAVRTVEGDPARTTPRPGETVHVEWQTAAPGRVEPTTWLLIACAPSDQAFGVPVCGGPPFQVATELTPQDAQPTVDIAVPADYPHESVVMLGVICMGGVVQTAIDPNASIEDLEPCSGGEGVGEIVTATIGVEQRPELRNLRPGLMSLTLGDVELTEAVEEARLPCVDGTLPQVSLNEEIFITIRAVPGSRESYVVTDGDTTETRVEDLQNSLFITEGALNRRFTFIDDGTPEPSVEFLGEADPDDPLPPEGRAVKLLVVMRDRRGGEDILRRGFCLVP